VIHISPQGVERYQLPEFIDFTIKPTNMTIINKLKQTIAYLQLRISLKQLKALVYDIPITKITTIPTFARIKLYGTELDYQYFTTDWENWNEILDRVYGILQDNPWTENKADCDNRAEFVSAFISIVYNLNTCARVYCEVSNATSGVAKYLHWCNIIVDKDNNLYLFDADSGGLRQKITSNTAVMGNNKYIFKSFRIG